MVSIPLDSASKDVKNSSLLSDTLEEQEYMTETLQKMDTEIINLDVCVYFTVYFRR
jgi:hypothetical protein